MPLLKFLRVTIIRKYCELYTHQFMFTHFKLKYLILYMLKLFFITYKYVLFCHIFSKLLKIIYQVWQVKENPAVLLCRLSSVFSKVLNSILYIYIYRQTRNLRGLDHCVSKKKSVYQKLRNGAKLSILSICLRLLKRNWRHVTTFIKYFAVYRASWIFSIKSQN